MNKENVLLILWIIFGFIFITGIDSALYFIIYLIYFVKSEFGVSHEILKFSMPIITIALYVIATLLIFKRFKTKSNSSGIYLTKFPKKLFVILGLIAIFLKPMVSKLSGLYVERLTTIGESSDASSSLEVYGWMTLGIFISRWLILVSLTIIFIKKLKLINQ